MNGTMCLVAVIWPQFSRPSVRSRSHLTKPKTFDIWLLQNLYLDEEYQYIYLLLLLYVFHHFPFPTSPFSIDDENWYKTLFCYLIFDIAYSLIILLPNPAMLSQEHSYLMLALKLRFHLNLNSVCFLVKTNIISLGSLSK